MMKTIAVLLPNSIPTQLALSFVRKLNSSTPGLLFQVPSPETEDEEYCSCLVIAPHDSEQRQAAYLGLMRGRGVPITVVNCWKAQDAFLWLRWADRVFDDLPSGIEHVCLKAGVKIPASTKETFLPSKDILWGAATPSAKAPLILRLIREEDWIPLSIQYPSPETLIKKQREYSCLGARKILICKASETEVSFVKSLNGIVFQE